MTCPHCRGAEKIFDRGTAEQDLKAYRAHGPGATTRLLIAGWATDLCVDATVRSAAALGYEVVVIADCHTVSDRPHLGAERVIEHHHWVWANLLAPRPVTIARAAAL